MFDQILQVLFGDTEGALELSQKEITLRISLKLLSLNCVSRACFFDIPMESR